MQSLLVRAKLFFLGIIYFLFFSISPAKASETVKNYYNSRGDITASFPYLDGQLHGTAKLYRDNHQVQSEAEFSHGQFDGVYRFYYSGNMVEKLNPLVEIHFKNNQYHGAYTYYNTSGDPILEWNFKQDKLDGIQKYYLEDGTLLRTEEYKQGQKIGETFHHERAYPIHDYELISETGTIPGGRLRYEKKKDENGDGVLIEYENKSGEIESITPLTNHKMNGFSKEYDTEGNLRAEKYYVYGRQEGISRHYYATGELSMEAHISGYTANGMMRSYHKTGGLRWEEMYLGHKSISERIYYDEDGYRDDSPKPKRTGPKIIKAE